MAAITQLRRRDYFANDEAQIAVMQSMTQDDMKMHRHEFAELAFVLSGSAVHVTGGVRHLIEAGDVLFINRSRSHAYEETRRFHLTNILVHEEVFREVEKELGPLPGYHALFTLESMRWRPREFTSLVHLYRSEFARILEWLKALKEETEKPNEGGRLLGRCWLILILGLLARAYSRKAADSPRLEMRLSRVLSWIGSNFQRPVRIGELAQQAAMSERTFTRRFREATGISASEYLIQARIRHAMELLRRQRESDTISEIAFRCGFEDSNYFARQFRRLTGKSPREYAAGTRNSQPPPVRTGRNAGLAFE